MSLSQIGLYNPQRQTDSQVEALFVIRKKQFKMLFDDILVERPGGIPQHHLIIAQRGMGKTTLLKRIEVELRKPEYSQQFIPLLFPEEQYNVKDLAEFWLNCLDAFADVMDVEKNLSKAEEIDVAVKELMKIREAGELATKAYEYLLQLSAGISRRPVLLIDNMNLIFDRMKKNEQHVLRALMMKNGAPIIVGGSTTYMEGTTDYGAPFYDAFKMHYLDRIKVSELIEMLVNLAQVTGEVGIIPSIHAQTGRLKALHQLTGGNPRTAVMLFKLIVKGFSNDINDDLEALLDEATPLYKARFEELSEQMQIIVDAVALHWDPVTLEQLRELTRYESGTLASQLKRLSEMGWVEKVNKSVAKGAAYEMSERFFNIWFLMRRSSRRQKKGVYCLSKFLEVYYGDEISDVCTHYLYSDVTNVNHVLQGLALVKVAKDEQMREKMRGKLQEHLFALTKTNSDLWNMFEFADIFRESSVDEMQRKCEEERAKGNFHVADRIVSEMLLEEKNDRGKAYLFVVRAMNNADMERYKEAETFAEAAIELANDDPLIWNFVGKLFCYFMKDFDRAEDAFQKAIQLDNGNMLHLSALASLYEKMERFDTAARLYEELIEMEPWESEFCFSLGHCYRETGRYLDAIEMFGRAVEIAPQEGRYLLNLGLIHVFYGNYNDGLSALRKAVRLCPENADFHYALAVAFASDRKHWEQAEKEFQKAINLNGESTDYQISFMSLYRDKMNEIDKAEALFEKIKYPEDQMDAYWIEKASFDLCRRNEGLATEHFNKALELFTDLSFSEETKVVWWKFAALALKKGYGQWLCIMLKQGGFDVLFAPYLVAIEAIESKKEETYLATKAFEVREVAKELINKIKGFM